MAEEATKTKEDAHSDEHYEIVAEYRVGEGAPPLGLIVVFFLIVSWAAFSWYPIFGY